MFLFCFSFFNNEWGHHPYEVLLLGINWIIDRVNILTYPHGGQYEPSCPLLPFLNFLKNADFCDL